MAKRSASPRQLAWRRSKRFREGGIAALKNFNAQRLAGTRCGAQAKSTGRPCQQPAMKNGRCHWHGGRVSRHWHVPDYERKDQPGAMDRAHAKLAKHEKDRQKRQRRVALMTDDERAKHQAWQKTHKPGSAGERARLRADRKAAAEFRARMEQLEPSKGTNK